MKECSKCSTEKPLLEYNKDKYRPDGRTVACKECRREQSRKYAARNKDKRRRQLKEWHEENPHMKSYYDAKYRAEKKGIPFTIEPEDVTIPDVCPVLGIELEKGEDKNQANSPSIDRIDPSKGYIPSNVKVVSIRANRIKNDATEHELQRVLNYVRRNS